jgi:transcription elongation factor GreA-like protein
MTFRTEQRRKEDKKCLGPSGGMDYYRCLNGADKAFDFSVKVLGEGTIHKNSYKRIELLQIYTFIEFSEIETGKHMI